MSNIVRVKPVIGMEVHIELSTRTKMFSRAPNLARPPAAAAESNATREHATANTAIDPVVLGLPGALPVLNREAITLSMMVGLALNCRIAPITKWDRKGYFYPDLPKGYQISQYDMPLCAEGYLDIPTPTADGRPDPESADTRRITIIRAHLEEDAGKLLHDAPGGGAITGSIVDLNRAGTPLLEIVTAPDFDSADRCVSFANLLRSLCRFMGVTEGIMQKGHIRFEPNINCQLTLADGRTVKTPIVEVKNLNSFKSLRGAIEYELAQQPARWQNDHRELRAGNKSTRGWDDARLCTVPQREKEEAADYRYFPDPDLLPVQIDQAWQSRVRDAMPTPPGTRMKQYITEYALSATEAAALVDERDVSDLYESTLDEAANIGVSRHRAARAAANLLLQSGAKRANERTAAIIAREGQHAQPVLISDLGVNAHQLAAIIALRESGDISPAGADELFGAICELRLTSTVAAPASKSTADLDDAALTASAADQATIRDLARTRGLILIRDDSAINAWVAEAIAQNPKPAEDVRAGKEQAIGRIVGSAMKLAGGKGDAAELRKRIIDALKPG